MSHTISLKNQDMAEMLTQVSMDLVGEPIKAFGIVPLSKLFKKGEIDAYAIDLTEGQDHFAMTMATSHAHGLTLAGRTIDKPKENLTPAIAQDAAKEWLNILAGQIKSLAGLDHTLGLPTVCNLHRDDAWQALQHTQGVWCEMAESGVVLWMGFTGPQPVHISQGEHS